MLFWKLENVYQITPTNKLEKVCSDICWTLLYISDIPQREGLIELGLYKYHHCKKKNVKQIKMQDSSWVAMNIVCEIPCLR